MGKTIRPELDEEYVRKIKARYPDETNLLSNAATIRWALDRFLLFKEIEKE